MKIIIPRIILEHIEKKCEPPGSRKNFLPKDAVFPIQDFIDTKLSSLDPILYQRYKDHRGTDERTLRYAWSMEAKAETGAIKELRNLLCYFGFGKTWSETLQYFKISESQIINDTQILKSSLSKMTVAEIQNRTSNEIGKELRVFCAKVYIELITRKAAIPIDENEDLIELIHTSWFSLFNTIRTELKVLPSIYFKMDGTCMEVLKLMLKILNEILRPHLTKHYSAFNFWLNKEISKTYSSQITLVKLQQQYPDYSNIMHSMLQTNLKLLNAANELYEFL